MLVADSSSKENLRKKLIIFSEWQTLNGSRSCVCEAALALHFDRGASTPGRRLCSSSQCYLYTADWWRRNHALIRFVFNGHHMYHVSFPLSDTLLSIETTQTRSRLYIYDSEILASSFYIFWYRTQNDYLSNEKKPFSLSKHQLGWVSTTPAWFSFSDRQLHGNNIDPTFARSSLLSSQH